MFLCNIFPLIPRASEYGFFPALPSRGVAALRVRVNLDDAIYLTHTRESRLEIRREPYDTSVCGSWLCTCTRWSACAAKVLWERVAKHGNMPATHLSQRGLPSCISLREKRARVYKIRERVVKFPRLLKRFLFT